MMKNSALICFVGVACLSGNPRAESKEKPTPWDDEKKSAWPDGFSEVKVQSRHDASVEAAYAYSASGDVARPLLVSLHTWGGNFQQYDPLAKHARRLNWNYIHPDFRGANRTPESCASPAAIADIDDAIAWCLEHQKVDPAEIFVVGVSGGGHAACAHFLNTGQPIKATYAWVPITDLEAWYHQGRARGNHYPDDILSVLGGETLDAKAAAKRSPLFMKDVAKRNGIHLFAGIHDGYSGSAPIDQSLRFWNRLCRDRGLDGDVVADPEIIKLLSKSAEKTEGKIGGRAIYLTKANELGSITIFEGGHEMLTEACIAQLREASEEPPE